MPASVWRPAYCLTRHSSSNWCAAVSLERLARGRETTPNHRYLDGLSLSVLCPLWALMTGLPA